MSKTMKLLKAGVGMVRMNSVFNREFSNSCSLASSLNIQQELFENYCQMKKKELEEVEKQIKGSSNQIEYLQGETVS